jgi:putative hydrolase of the HAD superfamily
LYAARREVVNLALQSLGINDTAAAYGLADDYGVEMEKYTAPFPGAMETLEHWKRSKVLLALLTNGASEIQRRKIDRFGLAPLFNIILIEEEMGFGKPDERVFHKALHHFGLGPGDAWMVGDDLERDIAGAQGAGIFSFWVDYRDKGLHPSSPIRPDRTIRLISELM